jgi:hypothetical protein
VPLSLNSPPHSPLTRIDPDDPLITNVWFGEVNVFGTYASQTPLTLGIDPAPIAPARTVSHTAVATRQTPTAARIRTPMLILPFRRQDAPHASANREAGRLRHDPMAPQQQSQLALHNKRPPVTNAVPKETETRDSCDRHSIDCAGLARGRGCRSPSRRAPSVRALGESACSQLADSDLRVVVEPRT